MTANLIANPQLTLEQDTFLRLMVLGWGIRSNNPNSDRFKVSDDFNRFTQSRNGNVLTSTFEPITTIQITFDLDPNQMFTALAGGLNLYEAIESFPAFEPLELGNLFEAPALIDSAFNLITLGDSDDSIPVDDNNNYLIEG